MTREEAKTVFLNRGYVGVEGGTIYDADKWRESCRVISEWLEQEPSKDMEEISEIINCDADVEIKLKMISNIVHSKPHYFKTSRENKIIDEHYWKGFSNGIRTAEWRATKQEPAYCDRNICLRNEYSGIGCDECEVTKSQEPCEDAISRQTIKEQMIKYGFHTSDMTVTEFVEDLPSVKPQVSCDVPDTNVGDIISKQTVLDTISELNAISFYEAQEDSKECYYEIIQAIKDLSPVKQEPKTKKVIKMRDATPEEQKSVNDYIKSISKPTGIDFDIDIDKKVESYGKLLKHPVVKHIMGMVETQETKQPEISSYYGLKSYVRERSDKE